MSRWRMTVPRTRLKLPVAARKLPVAARKLPVAARKPPVGGRRKLPVAAPGRPASPTGGSPGCLLCQVDGFQARQFQ